MTNVAVVQPLYFAKISIINQVRYAILLLRNWLRHIYWLENSVAPGDSNNLFICWSTRIFEEVTKNQITCFISLSPSRRLIFI